jgi:hypothetical protein
VAGTSSARVTIIFNIAHHWIGGKSKPSLSALELHVALPTLLFCLVMNDEVGIIKQQQ